MRTTHPKPEEFVLGKSRLESFSDGVFAVAITLLILEIRIPASASWTSSVWQQTRALVEIWPQYLVYGASFLTIGIMWINHHVLFDNARRITHRMLMANLLLLGLITFLPFTTEVLGRFGLTRTSVVYYGLVLTAISFAYFWVFWEVRAAHGIATRLERWNLGLASYPIAAIAGYFVPLLGIGIIIGLALFYAIPANIQTAKLRLEDLPPDQ